MPLQRKIKQIKGERQETKLRKKKIMVVTLQQSKV
jgi:hypothetical protein